MDITALRRELGLTPHDMLSFGAADRTGWMNVEVSDSLSGDYKVVGQLRGTAFRPMGASAASMNFAHRGARAGDGYVERDAFTNEESQAVAWFAFIGAPSGLTGVYALASFVDHHPWHGALSGALALLWLVGFTWYYCAQVAAPSVPPPAAAALQSPAEALPSSDFTIPTVNCPNCGYPVNTEQCPCCGWARPL